MTATPASSRYLEFFGRLTGVDLLHIDDLGTENRTEWVTEQLYSIVNERYESQRSLIVTTNRTRPSWSRRSASGSSPGWSRCASWSPSSATTAARQNPGAGSDAATPATGTYGDSMGGILGGPLD